MGGVRCRVLAMSIPWLAEEDPRSPALLYPDALVFLYTHDFLKLVYTPNMSRTNIEINDQLIRKARKLTRLKTKREIVNKALELLVRSETRKDMLRYYGSGVWKGELKGMRRNRV